jgi:hypothetical protein
MTPAKTIQSIVAPAVSIVFTSYDVQPGARKTRSDADCEVTSLRLGLEEGIRYFLGDAGILVEPSGVEEHFENLRFGVIPDGLNSGRLYGLVLH